jgi:hypothetical protein
MKVLDCHGHIVPMNDNNGVGDDGGDSPPTAENDTAAGTTAEADTAFQADAIRNLPTPASWSQVDDDDRLREAASGQAWSDADDDADDDGPESHPWSVVTGQAAVLISVGATVAAITVMVGWLMFHKDRPAPSPVPPTSTAEKNTSPTAAAAPITPPKSSAPEAAPPAPTSQPPPPSTSTPTVVAAPSLDGVYQLVSSGRITNLTPELYGFRFACQWTSNSVQACDATGVLLNSPDMAAGAPYGTPYTLRWANSVWRSEPKTDWYQCAAVPSGIDASYTSTRSLSLEPQADGTYRGTVVEIVAANECAIQAGTTRSAFTARKVGPRPPSADW